MSNLLSPEELIRKSFSSWKKVSQKLKKDFDPISKTDIFKARVQSNQELIELWNTLLENSRQIYSFLLQNTGEFINFYRLNEFKRELLNLQRSNLKLFEDFIFYLSFCSDQIIEDEQIKLEIENLGHKFLFEKLLSTEEFEIIEDEDTRELLIDQNYLKKQ